MTRLAHDADESADDTVARRRLGAALLGAAAAALLISLYLSVTRLAGGLPVCGPVKGCEEVALSEYSVLLGIPVAFLGVAYSAVLVALTLAWIRWSDRRALLALYGIGLAGTIMVAYLTYLEIFVIRAICVWCVGFAIVVVAAWLLALLALRRTA